MNQIVAETNISKGKVHYLINEWKEKIARSEDIDEIRDFIVLARKADMSIEQCTQGFRMISILKNLRIQEDISVDKNMTTMANITNSPPLLNKYIIIAKSLGFCQLLYLYGLKIY